MINLKFFSGSTPSRLKGVTGVVLGLVLAACSNNNNNNANSFTDISDNNPDDVNPFQELVDQGIARYLGIYTPMVTETVGDAVAHRFSASGDGPMCLRGGEYVMSTRDTGSEELVIFLQGGGGCWDTLCAATETAGPGILSVGILDQELAGNPVADWNVAYLPYCDGGVHASDAEYDVDGNGLIEAGTTDQFHHGLQNLSAALDVTVRTFPAPKRILLTGVSGGGFGTIFALPLVRTLYPGVPIEVLNDSGVAVGRPDEPEFFEDLLDYWNIREAFLPASCPDCIAEDGHGTGILDWAMQRDENMRVSLLSHKQDSTISTFFFGVGGPAWEPELIREMAEAEAAQPDRLRYMIADGSAHTFLLTKTDLVVDGISVMDWVTAMLDDSSGWTSRLD
jgi:hypothetical protein